MSNLPTLYNSLVDTLLAIARETELENDEVYRRLTQAIRTNIPDKADDLSVDSTPESMVEEASAYALARQAWQTANTALEEVRYPQLLPNKTVRTTEDDLVPGYLEDELVAGDLIKTEVVVADPVIDGNEVLVVSHDTPELSRGSGDFVANITGHNGVVVQASAPTEGEPYIQHELWEERVGDLAHSEMFQVVGDSFIVLASDGLVKVDAADTVPGVLNDEIIVDPGGGVDFWLNKSVTPGGAADNKLLIEHATSFQTAAYLEDVLRVTEEIVTVGGGVELVTDGSVIPAGYAYVDLPGVMLQADDAGHFGVQEDITDLRHIEWLALPEGTTAGDMLRWDGAKWVIIAAASATGDYILTSQDGVMSWVEMSTFACPAP